MKPINKNHEEKIQKLVSKMTLEEKIGQLTLFGSLKEEKEELLEKGLVGALLNVDGAKRVNEIQRKVIQNTRLGIPLLIGDDVIHGFRTTFPIPLATASSWDLNKIEAAERTAALEARASGVNWIYAPMVDIARDARWGRIAEGAGEDTYLGCEIAKARVRGFQSTLPGTQLPIVACCPKHYAAYGLAEGGRDYESADISDLTLFSVYLPPFKAAVDEGAMTIMSAFQTVNSIPASSNHGLITDVLKKQWGFEGFVVSDWESVMELIFHGVASDRKSAAYQGITAGVEMDMHSGVYIDYLEELCKEHPDLLNCINESVHRVLRIKFALGLFENPYVPENGEEIHTCTKHREQARDISASSMVLLKNENILPIKKSGLKILVTGPLAQEQSSLLGMWRGKGRPEDVVTLLEGLKNNSKNEYIYCKGVDFTSNDMSEFAHAKELCDEVDLIIYACGEHDGMTGENHNRTNLDLPGIQNQYLDLLKSSNKPIIAVLMTGRPMSIQHLHNTADTILLAWHCGIESGNAAADIIFGNYNPSGRLTASFPRTVGQVPIYYSKLNSGRPHFKRYLDVEDTPLYPFGYGLSYTNYEYSNLTIEDTTITSKDTLKFSVDVSNTGNQSGEEVIQVYFRDVVSSIATPVRRLCAFKKILLDVGETKTICFELSANKFSYVGSDLNEHLESGEFELYIGHDSTCSLKKEFIIKAI